jgi:NitT/TauT family transport system substrate-binding protein
MRRREILGSVAATSLLALGSLRPARAQALDVIKSAGQLTEDITNIFWAVKTGLFQRNGIDLQLVGTNSGSAAMAAVVTGSYEMARVGIPASFPAHLRGIPIVIVAPGLLARSSNPFSLLQTANDAPYKTGADLNGKTLGTPAIGDLNTLAVKAWVDKNGGDWRSLKFVEIPNSAMEAAIVQKRVDAGVIQSPQLAQSLQAKTTRTLGDAWGAIAPTFMAGAYFARTDWANAHGDLIRRYNKVYTEASNYVNTHYKETEPLVAELTKMELANVSKIPRGFNAPTMDVSLIQPLIDASAKFEHIPRGFPARDLVWEGFR